ncbi:MAG: hypothetical protein FWF04_01825 [Clostridiales bacterium]|nr:hypothetical protein [Clostridiales bacterium]
MKKFVFTLAAVAKYKKTVEKKQKAELSRVVYLLNTLYTEEKELLAAIADTAASLMRALAKNRDVLTEIKRHDIYQTFLRENLQETREKIRRAEAEKKRIQALLIITMKEQKTLDRLREEQYQAYLEEVRQEENTLIQDLISYKSVAEQE